jgi:predicted MPP superfamily phosphohydrolase
MRTSLSFFPFVAFMVISAPVQLYLFNCSRRYLLRHVHNAATRGSLVVLCGGFVAVMFAPIVWRAYGGLYGDWDYPRFVLEILTASLIWWIGSIGCVIVLLAFALFQRLLPVDAPAAPRDDTRRHFLQKSAGMAAAAPFMVSGYGVLLERRFFEVERFKIHVTGLPPALSPLTVVQLTDIHVGPFMSGERLRTYVRAVNRLDPDLIALTGDFVAGAQEEAAPCVEALAGLRARYGIFACLGNHDLSAGVAAELSALFASVGIRMLVNDAATVVVRGSRIALLGIDDLAEGDADLPTAVTAAEAASPELKILLSHRPEIFRSAAENGIDLVVAGHYHGGQIKLLPQPQALSIARFMTPFPEGVFRLPASADERGNERRASNLFVGRGIGITGLPIRINCPPQIAHLMLEGDKG